MNVLGFEMNHKKKPLFHILFVIEKSLNAYLDSKKLLFPRWANDCERDL
jgi:hypothetical protein